MKKIIALLASCTMLFAFASCSTKDTDSAEANYIYGQIESISGNDMTLLMAEYHEENEENQKDSASDETSESKTRKKPENFNGKKPEGFTKPEGFDGEMPEGFTPPENFSKEISSGNEQYTLTGEQENFQIPVGTEVITNLGVKTDFSALKAGNIIKCTVEQDENNQQVITAVWIMEA